MEHFWLPDGLLLTQLRSYYFDANWRQKWVASEMKNWYRLVYHFWLLVNVSSFCRYCDFEDGVLKNKCSLTHQCKWIRTSCLVIFTNIHRYIQKHMHTYMHMYIHAFHLFRIQASSRGHTNKCNWAELEPSSSTHIRMWVGFYPDRSRS